tara:strand:- start:249 stop:989 length:741 start_codon:yes stop_codon:yes gene_type:complete
MKVSIITPTYNSEQFLSDNLKSISGQRYKIFEHIFIDNNSKDRTLDILKKYKNSVNYKVVINSSKDRGIYDAFNKGLIKAKGDILTIVNSDDYFSNKYVLEKIYKKFKKKNIDFLYSNVKIVSRFKKEKILRFWKSGRVNKNDFYKVPHPSFFVKKNFIRKYNLNFNISYKIASDLDFIIKCFYKSLDYEYINKSLIIQRSGGTSQKFINILKANYEVFKICKKNKIRSKIKFIIKKILFKICQVQ